ncbi:hypothetical protein [Asticcacaulis endophyticus]|uniref:Uncharacterized protein n=1 Tax=Asticcacaulis endophyticus TaxID=1395890 RepID=A0A918QI46_9CAUL|nr:hypothetical protein [Asticcacaulis endophyticus]GGZ46022.1 hypothetical protein GCM10011273_35830 [Asticcacaulis endophyticus]
MIASWFLRSAIIFGIIGMIMGIVMGISHDHTLSPVHAHINLIGWVGLFLAGLFYGSHPAAAGKLATAHFYVAVIGLIIMAPGIGGSILGLPWGAPLAGIGSIITLIGFILFAIGVFRHSGARITTA